VQTIWSFGPDTLFVYHSIMMKQTVKLETTLETARILRDRALKFITDIHAHVVQDL